VGAYTEPGGTNYREIKIQLGGGHAEAEHTPDFESGHFDEPNIIVHARVKDREVPHTMDVGDGQIVRTGGKDKVLFVEELQSDWGEQAESGV